MTDIGTFPESVKLVPAAKLLCTPTRRLATPEKYSSGDISCASLQPHPGFITACRIRDGGLIDPHGDASRRVCGGGRLFVCCGGGEGWGQCAEHRFDGGNCCGERKI